MLGTVCAYFCTAALVQSCQQSNNDLVVYKAQSIVNGKVVDVIEGESVTMQIKVGDSVIVNLNDSEITDHLKEMRAMYYNPNNLKIDSASVFVVKSSYKSNK